VVANRPPKGDKERRVDPGEGLTIAMSWKKGTVLAVDLDPGSMVKIHGRLVAIPVPNPGDCEKKPASIANASP
jgi:hypothetical protein